MMRRFILPAVALAVLAAAGPGAWAETLGRVTASDYTFAYGGKATVHNDGVEFGSFGLGRFTFTRSDEAGVWNDYTGAGIPLPSDNPRQFNGYCIDIFDTVALPSRWTVESSILDPDEPEDTSPLDAQSQYDLRILYKYHTPISAGLGNLNYAAFQLALWEIMNENSPTEYVLESGSFYVTDAREAAASLANAWLADVVARRDGDDSTAPVLYALRSEFTQDQAFIATKAGPITPVPVPAAVWMGLSMCGCLGMVGWVRRRRAG